VLLNAARQANSAISGLQRLRAPSGLAWVSTAYGSLSSLAKRHRRRIFYTSRLESLEPRLLLTTSYPDDSSVDGFDASTYDSWYGYGDSLTGSEVITPTGTDWEEYASGDFIGGSGDNDDSLSGSGGSDTAPSTDADSPVPTGAAGFGGPVPAGPVPAAPAVPATAPWDAIVNNMLTQRRALVAGHSELQMQSQANGLAAQAYGIPGQLGSQTIGGMVGLPGTGVGPGSSVQSALAVPGSPFSIGNLQSEIAGGPGAALSTYGSDMVSQLPSGFAAPAVDTSDATFQTYEDWVYVSSPSFGTFSMNLNGDVMAQITQRSTRDDGVASQSLDFKFDYYLISGEETAGDLQVNWTRTANDDSFEQAFQFKLDTFNPDKSMIILFARGDGWMTRVTGETDGSSVSSVKVDSAYNSANLRVGLGYDWDAQAGMHTANAEFDAKIPLANGHEFRVGAMYNKNYMKEISAARMFYFQDPRNFFAGVVGNVHYIGSAQPDRPFGQLKLRTQAPGSAFWFGGNLTFMPDNSTDSLFQVHTDNADGGQEDPNGGYGTVIGLNILSDGETGVEFTFTVPIGQ
jgi:hypothetical protein